MHSIFRRISRLWTSVFEKQGFPVVVTVCVAVITFSALWTGKQPSVEPSPTPFPGREQAAAQLFQQSLKDAVRPAPTSRPCPWHPPVKEFSVLQPFDTRTMQQGSITGIWQVHAGVDLASSPGSPVCAMADGIILARGADDLFGVWLRVEHDNVTALYAGMQAAEDLLPGDQVKSGDVIGYAGSGPLEESDLPAHLHLETTRDNIPFDPLTLWQTP